MKTDICIIGAGPAGIFAAIFAAQTGAKVIVVERNTSPCRKLLRTGRSRCNLTHTGSVDDFIRSYAQFGRFLKHSMHEFCADDLREYFTDHGLKTKIENNGCVFPVTDRATDVAAVLIDHAKSLSVKFLYGKEVQTIQKQNTGFITTAGPEKISSNAVIIAAGGVTWPVTGSTGDGYKFAKSFDHKIIEPRASLASLITLETWPQKLAGIGLPEVVIKTKINNRKISSAGAIMFTRTGIGGPAVFELSRFITDFLPAHKDPIKIDIDLLPKIQIDQLDKEVIDLCKKHPKKDIAGAMAKFFPKSLTQQICIQLFGSKTIQAGSIQKDQRKKIVQSIKKLPLSIVETCPIDQATVTRGGVCTTGIDPLSMQSKLCDGLYFAGEIINADGPCGGYNLQIAFSTGRLAGISAAKN